MWDYLTDITTPDEYVSKREYKRETYSKTPFEKITRLRQVSVLSLSESDAWKKRFKAIMMKLVQILVFSLNGTMSYTKEEIARDSRIILSAYPSEISGEELV